MDPRSLNHQSTSSPSVARPVSNRLNTKDAFSFLEIGRLPKNTNCKSLVSLIVSASRIRPIKADICIKKDFYGGLQQVGLIEYNNEKDAYFTATRLRQSAFAKSWRIEIVKDPSLSDLDKDQIEQWLRG